MLRNYIGLATSCHDPALAIVNQEGEVVFAESAERYLQNKRAWNSIPDDIIRIPRILDRYCSDKAELVVVNTWTSKFIGAARFISPFFSLYPEWAGHFIDQQEYTIFSALFKGMMSSDMKAGRNLLMRRYEKGNASGIIKKSYDHHLTHAAVSCWSSPFDESVCAVIDAYGEYSSTAFFHYEKGKIRRLKWLKPSWMSIGMIYAYLCYACGWDLFAGEEWKVMGLAPYGKLDKKFYQFLHSIIKVEDCTLVSGSKGWNLKTIFPEFRRLRESGASPLDSADLAYTGQLFFCEIVAQLLGNLYKKGISDNLVLGGGCALNSACNGKIPEMTPFKNLYVFSAPADDGNAIGAALLAYYEDNPIYSAPAKFQSPYLGSSMCPHTLERVKKMGKLPSKLKGKNVCQRAAELLAKGKIIGWVQGRAEFGPRALGNRSILADARYADVKQRINDLVKFREEFRPFAPSILHQYGPDYFENYSESPYMERALKFKPEAAEKVPGVVHVDGTGRLQTVKREWNEKYYDLIMEFFNITGIPLILNTSFNIMGKPIIHSVEDALAVFFTTGLDALVIEDELFEKPKDKKFEFCFPWSSIKST